MNMIRSLARLSGISTLSITARSARSNPAQAFMVFFNKLQHHGTYRKHNPARGKAVILNQRIMQAQRFSEAQRVSPSLLSLQGF